MRKIVFFLLLAFIATSLSAQSPINLGIKAGFNSSKITTESSQFNEGSVNNYLAGAFARLNLGKVYLQPEAYFNSKGGKLKEVTSGMVVNNFDLKTVDVPVLLGVKVFEKASFNLRANAGPLFTFVTDKGDVSPGFNMDSIKDSFFGWQYGVGADFMFLSLDVRMESSSGEIYDGSRDDGSKSKVFVISLGFKLL